MKRSRIAILVIAVGAVIILAFSAIYILDSSLPRSGVPTPIDQALWMRGVTAGSSGNVRWYNITLTVNGSIPLSDLLFLFLNSEADPVGPPPTFTFSVMSDALPIAEYNFTDFNWTSGGTQVLVSGDWFEFQGVSQSLTSDKLVAEGRIVFGSACSIVFP